MSYTKKTVAIIITWYFNVVVDKNILKIILGTV